MNKLRSIVAALCENFSSIIYQSNASAPQVEKQIYLVMGAVAFALLGLAAIGYFTQSYHWGFAAINAGGERISPVFLHNLTTFGDGIFVVSLVLYVANKNIPTLYTALLAAIIGGTVSQCLKHYFNADRPPAVLELDTFNLVGKAYSSRSFPSGHTLTAFLVATVFICFSRKKIVQLSLLALAIFVGLSRVWLGVHWFIDILVGGALGIFCGLAAVYISQKSAHAIPKGLVLFIIVLFAGTAISALVEPNDYRYAQPMISLIAVLALWQTFRHYLRPGFAMDYAKGSEKQLYYMFVLTLLSITAYRIFVLFQPHLSLFYDEAYYYHWSLAPDLGYYSKPPFVAWFISIGTLIAGQTVVGVKLAAPILYSISSYLIFLTAKKVATLKAGVVAALVFLSSTVVGFNSEFITTDAPLILFWSLSIYLFVICLQTNRLSPWLALGVAVGCGMLSKYTMAALPLSLFAYLILSEQHRAKLATYKPWLAAIIAGLLFSLNLWWNSQNGWISFAHTSEISQQGKHGLNILGFLEFAAGQIFVLGPVWFWLTIVLLKKRKHIESECKSEYSDAPKLFLIATLGILLIISLQALSSRAFINWAAPWIVGCSLAIGVYVSAFNVSRYLRTGLVAHLLLLSAFYHWPLLLDQLQIEQSRKNNPYQRLAGWDGIAKQLIPTLDRYPKAKLASNSRDLLAYVGFHAKPGEYEFVRWNPDENNVRDQYDLKYNFRNYAGTNTSFIFISRDALSPQLIRHFDEAFSLGTITQTVYRDKQLKIFVYRLVGFNGYE